MFDRGGAMARRCGMDLYSVFSRGSQFRVESILLRKCKEEGCIPPSPTMDMVSSCSELWPEDCRRETVLTTFSARL